MEDEAAVHENFLADMRHKHSQELNVLNEQLENFRKNKTILEKAKQSLEADNADLATELRNVNSARQENDRRRKQAEQQIAEIQVRINTFYRNCSKIDIFNNIKYQLKTKPQLLF